MRKYLAGGSTLTADERRSAETLREQLVAGLESAALPEARGARLAIVAKLLLGYPIANANEATGQARGEVYLMALDDVPPWAVQQAVRAWVRGGGAGNHDFAPSPTRLRELSLEVVAEHRAAIRDLDDLLAAVSLERAMDAKPLPKAGALPAVKLRAV